MNSLILPESFPNATFSGALPTRPEGIPFRLTADTFNGMIEAKLFEREDRVGLWDGQIHEKMPRDQIHHMLPTFVMYALLPKLPAGWFHNGENLIELGPHHLPLIDQSVLRGIPRDYRDHWPRPTEVGLIAEWTHKSLEIDFETKLAKYAEVGIATYWMLDLHRNRVRTYESPVPTERRYAQEAVFAIKQSIPLRLDGALVAEIPVRDLIPIRTPFSPETADKEDQL